MLRYSSYGTPDGIHVTHDLLVINEAGRDHDLEQVLNVSGLDRDNPADAALIRMEEVHAETYGTEWHYVGIKATSFVRVIEKGHVVHTEHKESPGCFAVPSYNGEAYYYEIFKEECRFLEGEIRELAREYRLPVYVDHGQDYRRLLAA